MANRRNSLDHVKQSIMQNKFLQVWIYENDFSNATFWIVPKENFSKPMYS